ncbi:glycosyltransferase [Roseibium aggregatum]|uniref:Glycosyltransferase n=1 Tax=Roseibium aggregatum TaxID=187304 RepID=A0A939EFE6_9HYPH|nr:glycosyltransferase [Roseibium aggregatum]MBN9672241.1 glycosyltransferase [Roseibium aggregatum]
MHIVFVHRHGPGQFVHIARRLIAEGWTVTLICETIDRPVPGLRVLRYADTGGNSQAAGVQKGAKSIPYIEAGRRVAAILNRMNFSGRKPDLVMGHTAWGGMSFIKDVLPDTPAIGYCEYYFQPKSGDVGFEPGETETLQQRQTIRLRNAVQLTALDQVDCGISPTAWQKSRYPEAYRSKILVHHEGIDCHRARPDPLATFRLADGTLLTAGDPVVTFAARDLEPYRGFPQFMRAAAMVAEHNPSVRFVVAGGDGVSYGQSAGEGTSWRKVLLEETGLAPDRIHFLGQIPHKDLIRLFQVTAAHVYLTYPFVLSWSLLEAMACGAPIVGSRTAPVQEVIAHGKNGLLADFQDVEQIAARIEDMLERPEAQQTMRATARQTVQTRFELTDCVLRLQTFLQKIIARGSRSDGKASQVQFP